MYFGCNVGDQDKKCAPYVCCTTCSSKLNAWVNGKGRFIPFGVPMVWRLPSNHITDSLFCMLPPIQNGMSMTKKSALMYPNIPPAIRLVPHGDGLSVPEPPDNFTMYSVDVSSYSEEQKSSSSRIADYLPSTDSSNLNPYPTAFPYGNGMVLHFYQQQESSTTKTVHKVINKGLKTYV